MKKGLFIVTLLLSFFMNSYSLSSQTNQWKLVIYPFENKTDQGREENLKLVIQNSIKTFLSKVDYLNISLANKDKPNFRQVMKDSYAGGFDILIDGNYAVIQDRIYIFVSVYDILTKQLKFQNSYSGQAGNDIFDTLDIIIDALKKDVTRSVQPMDEETLVKYRKRVELVSDDIQLKRTFVTTLGWNSAISDKYTGVPYIGLEINLENFIFGLSTFMPLLLKQNDPQDYWRNNFAEVYAGYRFKPVTVMLGILPSISLIETTTDAFSNKSTFPAPSIAPTFRLKYEWTDFFDITAGISLAIDYPVGSETRMIPVFNAGLDIYITDNFGMTLEAYTGGLNGQFDNYGQPSTVSVNNLIILSGLNYRVDFK